MCRRPVSTVLQHPSSEAASSRSRIQAESCLCVWQNTPGTQPEGYNRMFPPVSSLLSPSRWPCVSMLRSRWSIPDRNSQVCCLCLHERYNARHLYEGSHSLPPLCRMRKGRIHNIPAQPFPNGIPTRRYGNPHSGPRLWASSGPAPPPDSRLRSGSHEKSRS